MQRKRDRSTLELPWPAPDLKPGDDRLEPRLWIRRLRLWHDFGDDNPEHGRTVEFRRGLNIISSPASSTAEHVPTGHAAGKTLLCRQIRYCLGEDTFADPDDTGTIRSILKSGGVGAEVRLCGETWVVRRAFNSRADDRAMRGERIEELGDDSHRDTYGAFRTAIEAFAFTDAHRGLLNELGDVEVS